MGLAVGVWTTVARRPTRVANTTAHLEQLALIIWCCRWVKVREDGADLIPRKRLAYLRLASAIGLAPLRIPVSLIVLTGGAWALMLPLA